MESALPNKSEIEELLAFLPVFREPGVEAVEAWHGGPASESEPTVFPWPEYSSQVERFIRAAAKPCWCDYDYSAEKMSKMVRDPDAIRKASLEEVRSMLTFCVRGVFGVSASWTDVGI